MIRAIVITGYGINCEKEMAYACELAGAKVDIVHSQTLLTKPELLKEYSFLLLPGGFSFGDDLGAGKALANRLSYSGELKKQLLDFVEAGKCILGVCNGFQLLVKLGLLPGNQRQEVSLTHNATGKFQDRWVSHTVPASHSIFTRGLENLYLPIRHGEGKFVTKNDSVLHSLENGGQIALKYTSNPNGSQGDIAGICDSTGRILGMMAHPEAALHFTNHPRWTRIKEQASRTGATLPKEGEGLALFKNAITYLEENR